MYKRWLNCRLSSVVDPWFAVYMKLVFYIRMTERQTIFYFFKENVKITGKVDVTYGWNI
jgi:hypothetical protein